MAHHKKSWKQPQLIILSRGTPQESVLLHCKYIGDTALRVEAVGVGQQGCDKSETDGNCGACQARAGS